MEACLLSFQFEVLKTASRTYDITQGMLISELTAPNETLIPQRRVAPTIRSLIVLSPVVKLRTAPGPEASRRWTS